LQIGFLRKLSLKKSINSGQAEAIIVRARRSKYQRKISAPDPGEFARGLRIVEADAVADLVDGNQPVGSGHVAAGVGQVAYFPLQQGELDPVQCAKKW
jgi:hypothetical protein